MHITRRYATTIFTESRERYFFFNRVLVTLVTLIKVFSWKKKNKKSFSSSV